MFWKANDLAFIVSESAVTFHLFILSIPHYTRFVNIKI